MGRAKGRSDKEQGTRNKGLGSIILLDLLTSSWPQPLSLAMYCMIGAARQHRLPSVLTNHCVRQLYESASRTHNTFTAFKNKIQYLIQTATWAIGHRAKPRKTPQNSFNAIAFSALRPTAKTNRLGRRVSQRQRVRLFHLLRYLQQCHNDDLVRRVR